MGCRAAAVPTAYAPLPALGTTAGPGAARARGDPSRRPGCGQGLGGSGVGGVVVAAENGRGTRGRGTRPCPASTTTTPTRRYRLVSRHDAPTMSKGGVVGRGEDMQPRRQTSLCVTGTSAASQNLPRVTSV